MASIEKLEQTMENLSSGADKLLGRVQAHEAYTKELRDEVLALNTDLQVLDVSATVLEKLLKSVSVESLQTVEKLVSYGLRVSFHDRSLALKIEASQKRGQQHLELKFSEKNIEAPILTSFGGGAGAVAAFLLRLLVCRRMGLAPVLLLDEPFSFVSAEYRDNVGKLLRELCDSLKMTILHVTHDRDAYLGHATLAYEGQETSLGTVFNPIQLKS